MIKEAGRDVNRERKDGVRKEDVRRGEKKSEVQARQGAEATPVQLEFSGPTLWVAHGSP